MYSKTKKAFTIVELVIVIAVIAILMAIMFVGGRAITNNARASTLESDFRSFETNIKAMINDPDADCIATTAHPIKDGFNPTIADTPAARLLKDYFEDDLYPTLTATNVNTNAAASRTTYEGTTMLEDPYGVPYNFVVIDNSDPTHTDISFLVYSCGVNKQGAKDPGKLDADDVGFVVRLHDSIIYTGEIGPEVVGTNGADHDNGLAYQTAIDVTITGVDYVAHDTP